ncbi:TylF/MycF/NovP-related O-methyltransferase [Enterocloster bolteae]|uniref:TylF/MycF/NovP-related O-methyltransferase n=1 Tax=Enterocloster bolteae TaxID=208479 RepID=UPI002A7F5F75|nr:TylF/MycF/NovP-related O-methyltransferase [Enterocloster bolteae]
MGNAIIYGATTTGKGVYANVHEKYNILYFVDGDSRKHGTKVFGLDVKSPDSIFTTEVDVVIMGILTGWEEVVEYLISKGFPEERIVCRYVDLSSRARIAFLENAARILKERDVQGAVAELGVYRGDFAKEINRVFPQRDLYLYDTFEGFPAEDFLFEMDNGLILNDVGKFADTSEDYVLSRMPNKEKCIIRKGYFPDSASTDSYSGGRFAFVNIDVDLYKPLFAGLEYFWPRLNINGYLLVHDYFSLSYSGAKKAIDEFSEKNHLVYSPIGDTLSVIFVKN